MIDLIFLVIFIISFGAALLILARKLPVLTALPHHGTTGIRKHRVISDIEGRAKEIYISFKKQIFLHKMLSWFKIMTLRIETKIDHWLHKIRKQAQEIDKELKNK